MGVLLMFMFIAIEEKALEVRFTDVAPKIDGAIEEVWYEADSVYDFVQYVPYEKTEPTERTVVYALQDENNLYFAFRCHCDSLKPIACYTRDEDYVRVSIDPFGSKTTGYYFLVFASNLHWDGWIMNDGRRWDDSWQGVWYRATGVYDDRVEFEIKIPFKSIRYMKNLDEWGIQFMRHCADNLEDVLWTEVSQAEGERVSEWGVLKNVNPQATGYYFELFPEGFIRNDTYEDDPADDFWENTKLSASLNLKWDITPQMSLNATVNPDFAHIESDPFTLNLSRYPVYFDERRPFFIEGSDIFRMSSDALQIFYSRRIGKSINGDAVPIISGLKLTNNANDWNLGMLGAYTDDYIDTLAGIAEPSRWFGVARARRRVFGNSDAGVLVSSMYADTNDYNYAIGFDGAFRQGANQFVTLAAVSNRNGKYGYAVTSEYYGFIGNFRASAEAEFVGDSFDVSDIGFVPWAGQRRFTVFFGPHRTYRQGPVRQWELTPGFEMRRIPGETEWSTFGALEYFMNFRRNWGFEVDVWAGRAYEAGTDYFSRNLNISSWATLFGQVFNCGVNYGYAYNYFRGYPAYQATSWLQCAYSIIPPLSVVLGGNLWAEWDTANHVIAMWPRIRPRIDLRVNADMTATLFNEFVLYTPEADIGRTEYLANRIGFLYSWNFKPKSWLYIALNDYRTQDEYGDLQHQYTISAIKVKYLLYF